MTGNQGWQIVPRHGMIGSQQWISGVVCFIFSLLGRNTVISGKKKTIPCVCFRPQHSWTVKLSIPNLNLDLKFTSRREKTTFSQGNDGKVLVPVSPLLVSGSHAAPLPDLPQFESNHKRPIGCSGHVTYLGPKSTAFSDWSRIFPMGAAYRASAVWACVCVWER